MISFFYKFDFPNFNFAYFEVSILSVREHVQAVTI
jgi:hypothetical protein